MNLVQLIYASTSAGLNRSDVQKIIEKAREKNARLHVTGALCFSVSHFLQALEGPRGAVNQIYHTILKDVRHVDPVLLHYTEIHERNFAHWSMAYVGDTSLNRERILRYSRTDQFEPARMFGASARGLLLELANSKD